MRLKKLTLFNFKNYEEAIVELTGEVQCFFGKNGSGKTNLLDAVHYLSFTKSAINPSDAGNIRHGEQQFLIAGTFEKSGRSHDVTCAFQSGSRKILSEDGNPCAKFSSHIGQYPLVLVAPNDIGLIWDGSELRRRFFDNLLSQTDPEYLANLIIYSNYLKQRNGLLKMFFERKGADRDLLDAYDARLVPAGEYIFRKRTELMIEFQPVFESYYHFLAGGSPESIGLVYRSGLAERDFGTALKDDFSKDVLLQRTGTGIHRDDFLFLLDGGELRRYGSQGQQKSFLVGLKLAEFQMIAQKKQIKPLLLLDDIFDKLDDDRIAKLMMLVADGTFGQMLITDARADRARDLLAGIGVSVQLFEVRDNAVFSKADL